MLGRKSSTRTFNAGVDTATVDRRDTTTLCRDGTDFVFMDVDYERHRCQNADAARFLCWAMPVQVAFHNGVPLYIEAAEWRETEVATPSPSLQGAGQQTPKPATLQTGRSTYFVHQNKLRIGSCDGNYLGRVSA